MKENASGMILESQKPTFKSKVLSLMLLSNVRQSGYNPGENALEMHAI